jgi:hypothetical protein
MKEKVVYEFASNVLGAVAVENTVPLENSEGLSLVLFIKGKNRPQRFLFAGLVDFSSFIIGMKTSIDVDCNTFGTFLKQTAAACTSVNTINQMNRSLAQ